MTNPTVIRNPSGKPTRWVVLGGVKRALPIDPEGADMAGTPDYDSVTAKLWAELDKQLQGPNSTEDVLRLAEAYAWLVNPHQPHGGTAPPPATGGG